jgi:hypothetical protein
MGADSSSDGARLKNTARTEEGSATIAGATSEVAEIKTTGPLIEAAHDSRHVEDGVALRCKGHRPGGWVPFTQQSALAMLSASPA